MARINCLCDICASGYSGYAYLVAQDQAAYWAGNNLLIQRYSKLLTHDAL
jgi:hypothetical protein